MRNSTLSLLFAASVAVVFAQAPATAAPISGASPITRGIDSPYQDVRLRVFIYRHHRYCFYFDGWHGPGWYRCGWAWRRGYGWGGTYGWNDWEYGPAAARFGRHSRERNGSAVIRGGRTNGPSVVRPNNASPTIRSNTSRPTQRSAPTRNAPTMQQRPAVQQSAPATASPSKSAPTGGGAGRGGEGGGRGDKGGGQRGNDQK
jgi:hypothetical protein